jgi:16S rRNA (cytidine1402-2'-O)-methyltransferase
VIAVPGASAVLTALTATGLPTDRFFFEGFLPPKQVARQKRIAEIANVPATLVLFESGPRLGAALAELTSVLGTRDAAICRELTKLHEEIRRGDLEQLAQHYAANAETRGEIVIVVAPPGDDTENAGDVDELLRQALARVSVKDAVGEVALATGRPRREVYQRALALAKEDGDGAP